MLKVYGVPITKIMLYVIETIELTFHLQDIGLLSEDEYPSKFTWELTTFPKDMQ